MLSAERKAWDFFVSYASEDRATAATPLADELTRRGFKVWLDQRALSGTDNLEDQIRLGLENCHYGIVVISPRFVAKDWPMRELDTLLAIETIDGRYRVLPVLHNLTVAELLHRAPSLAKRRPISTAGGFRHVGDEILELVVMAVDRDRRDTLGELGAVELAKFRGPSLHCPNQECTWQAPPDWPDFLRSAGPEFTLAQVGSKWCVVCAACGAAVGWVTPEEAKQLAAMNRVYGLWAPGKPRDRDDDNSQ